MVVCIPSLLPSAFRKNESLTLYCHILYIWCEFPNVLLFDTLEFFSLVKVSYRRYVPTEGTVEQ